MAFYTTPAGLIKHHKAPFILCISWPDQPGEDDDREFSTLEEAYAFIKDRIHNMPWSGPRPSYCLTDADGEVIEES